MRHCDTLFRALAFVLLIISTQSGAANALTLPKADGWYRWTTPAQNVSACCYEWRNHEPVMSTRGCNLDERNGMSHLDCDAPANMLAIYVQLKDGKPRSIRALAANCPVDSTSQPTDLGQIEPAASARWLRNAMLTDSEHVDDYLVAIALHRNDVAFANLRDILENRNNRQRLREQALFWLAQSESQQAYNYLDKLLSAR